MFQVARLGVIALALILTSTTTMATEKMSTPRAAQKPHTVKSPFGERQDPWYWLRDDERQNPDDNHCTTHDTIQSHVCWLAERCSHASPSNAQHGSPRRRVVRHAGARGRWTRVRIGKTGTPDGTTHD